MAGTIPEKVAAAMRSNGLLSRLAREADGICGRQEEGKGGFAEFRVEGKMVCWRKGEDRMLNCSFILDLYVDFRWGAAGVVSQGNHTHLPHYPPPIELGAAPGPCVSELKINPLYTTASQGHFLSNGGFRPPLSINQVDVHDTTPDLHTCSGTVRYRHRL
jgi:hypothetical protein